VCCVVFVLCSPVCWLSMCCALLCPVPSCVLCSMEVLCCAAESCVLAAVVCARVLCGLWCVCRFGAYVHTTPHTNTPRSYAQILHFFYFCVRCRMNESQPLISQFFTRTVLGPVLFSPYERSSRFVHTPYVHTEV
jgi:hypothetical protein